MKGTPENIPLMQIKIAKIFVYLVIITCGLFSGAFAADHQALPGIGNSAGSSLPPVFNLLLDSNNPKTVPSYPLRYGRWGVPEHVLVLPEKADGTGYYYKDIQASFPAVDWQSLERLYIPAGNYSFINIGNLPERSADNPLIITNHGGQVRVGGYGHYYLFVIGGGKNWVLTGRYDPQSLTGDSGYKGHWARDYQNSPDNYGILVDDNFVRPSVSGLAIGGKATNFEVEFIEIRQVGFAGMTVKTDDDGSATMENVKIHDTYIHDTLSEGYYIGSTQQQPQHLIRNLELYNNRVVRSGTEAIQLGQLGGEVHIHNNVFALSAVHWKDAFQPWQDGNFQIGNRTGDLLVENNIFIGAAGNLVFASGQRVYGDTYPQISTVTFRNNYFSSTRSLFFYLRNDEFPGLRYSFENNFFTHMDFQRLEIDPNASAPNTMIRSFTPAPVTFSDNVWNVELDFSAKLVDGNGIKDNYSGSGNIRKDPPALPFINNGFTDDFDYLKVEVWAATAGRGGDQPINYEFDDIALYLGKPYRCRLITCLPGNVPSDNPDIWQPLPFFADDWRVDPSSGYNNLGLMY
jgi:hypothetical protein